jgi:Domain of unknown function (DUF4410)
MFGFQIGKNVAAITLTALFVVGCGTVQHKVSLEQGYRVQPGTKVAVGAIKNTTGQSFDIDIEKMLGDALTQTLKDRNLYWTSDPAPKLILHADIVEYSKGDAFKRWLMPGYGATALVVRATLTDTDNRKVGVVEAKRTVEAGGGYTIGAWESVFRDVAGDVVADLEKQMKPAP